MNTDAGIFNSNFWNKEVSLPGASLPQLAPEKKAAALPIVQFFQRLFSGDLGAKSPKDLAMVASLSACYEELKASEAKLAHIKENMDKYPENKTMQRSWSNQLRQARGEWEAIQHKLLTFKTYLPPNIKKTGSFLRLASLEKKIDKEVKSSMFILGCVPISDSVKNAIKLNQQLDLMPPLDNVATVINNLEMLEKTPPDKNLFNKDLLNEAQQIKAKLSNYVAKSHLKGLIDSVVKKEMAPLLKSETNLTAAIKDLLLLGLTVLRQKNQAAYQTTPLNFVNKNPLDEIKSMILNNSEEINTYIDQLDMTPSAKKALQEGLKGLQSEALKDLAKLQNQQLIQVMKKAIPEMAQAPHLLSAAAEIFMARKGGVEELKQMMQQTDPVDRLLSLAMELNSQPLDPKWAKGLKELDRLQERMLKKQKDSLPTKDKKTLEKLQAFLGNSFKLPLTQELALISLLKDPTFSRNFPGMLRFYSAPEFGRFSGSLQALWTTQVDAEPFLGDAYTIKRQAARPLEAILLLKAGEGSPLLLEQHIVSVGMSKEQLMQHPNLGRPIREKEIATKNLERFTPDEQLLLTTPGFYYNHQLGCFEYFKYERDSTQNCILFHLGYALPEEGVITTQISLDLAGFKHLDQAKLFLLVQKGIQGGDIGELADLINDLQLSEAEVTILKARVSKLKEESDARCHEAFQLLGKTGTHIPPHFHIPPWKITPWKGLKASAQGYS